MKNKRIKICDTPVEPGESASLALPLPEIYSCTPMYMPVRVINGKDEGPCTVIYSVVNGNELNGLEIINQLLAHESLNEIKGTIIAIPVLNIFGMMHHPKLLPNNESLAECFPGNESGSYGQRVASMITEEILKKADYCIELQTGDIHHEKLPQIYCSFNDNNARKLAQTFQAPVITEVDVESSSLRSSLAKLNVPLLVYEAGEALRFNDSAIHVGLNGVLNILNDIEMIDGLEKTNDETIQPVFSQDEDWLLSPRSGIFNSQVTLGDMITKGQVVGRIADPLSPDFEENIKSTYDGIVVGINTHPLMYEGQPILKIASFIDNSRAESTIEQWEEMQPDDKQD